MSETMIPPEELSTTRLGYMAGLRREFHDEMTARGASQVLVVDRAERFDAMNPETRRSAIIARRHSAARADRPCKPGVILDMASVAPASPEAVARALWETGQAVSARLHEFMAPAQAAAS